ncbi:unnamed protein product [Durusdinium trenchii]|uniref:Uncharacterized protein n=1 Tax=Durusdinium trenchii TaxID=1381693 RepID=A0ABP0MFR9_9DINO
MAASPEGFLHSYEAKTTHHWNAALATHAEIKECQRNRNLSGLMTMHSAPGEESQLEILALKPEPYKSDCAEIIRGYGKEAGACVLECQKFDSVAQGELNFVLESALREDYQCDALTHALRNELNTGASAVEETKVSFASVQGKSYTQALLQQFPESVVNDMTDEQKREKYPQMQRQLYEQHVKGTKSQAASLLQRSTLPSNHVIVQEKQHKAEALQLEANLMTSRRTMVEVLRAGLEEQQADARDKKLRCTNLRRVTCREEATKREALEEAEKAHMRAWREYQDAYIRDEAVVILEADLSAADKAVTEALTAAELACQEVSPIFQRCEEQAARCTAAVSANTQAFHARLLVKSKPTVEAAWKNTAFASELGKCALAAKYKEIDHLYKEQRRFQERAQRQKQPVLKAETLEKVEQLDRQIGQAQREVSELQDLVARAEEQFQSFRVLNSGLDEEDIRKFAQEKAAACYGDVDLFASDDSDDASTAPPGSSCSEAIQPHVQDPMEKLRIEMEEKFKIEKQQLVAEFQMEWQHKLLQMRQEWLAGGTFRRFDRMSQGVRS